MYINRSQLEMFPYKGTFFTKIIDESLPPSQQIPVDSLVLETNCDIQEVSQSDSGGFITASFAIYFPFADFKQFLLKHGITFKVQTENEELAFYIGEKFELRRGMSFKSNLYGMPVQGKIIGLFPTQMGMCKAYIKDEEV